MVHLKRFVILFFVTLLALPAWTKASVCARDSDNRQQNACMPVVFVIRHAEDTKTAPHALTAEGRVHAGLYPMLFNNYIYGDTHSVGIDKSPVCVCPIGQIISISDQGGSVSPRNPNPYPSSNPFNTILPLSVNLGIPVTKNNDTTQYWSSFQWKKDAKNALFANQGNQFQNSVVIAWDKQGLNPSEDDYNELMKYLTPPESNVPFEQFIPLLKGFPVTIPGPTSAASDPSRTSLWVYSDQAENGRFNNLRLYQQMFYDKDCKSNETFTPTTKSECILVLQRPY